MTDVSLGAPPPGTRAPHGPGAHSTRVASTRDSRHTHRDRWGRAPHDRDRQTRRVCTYQNVQRYQLSHTTVVTSQSLRLLHRGGEPGVSRLVEAQSGAAAQLQLGLPAACQVSRGRGSVCVHPCTGRSELVSSAACKRSAKCSHDVPWPGGAALRLQSLSSTQ